MMEQIHSALSEREALMLDFSLKYVLCSVTASPSPLFSSTPINFTKSSIFSQRSQKFNPLYCHVSIFFANS